VGVKIFSLCVEQSVAELPQSSAGLCVNRAHLCLN
jgi:hypothetical protein